MPAFPAPRCRRAIRVGISGTGFIALGLIGLLGAIPDFSVNRVLSRRSRHSITQIDRELITHSHHELAEHSDVVVECSGDVVRAADVVDTALQAGKPVVTMGTEFHVTVGSYFCDQGLLTEAEGDQPGTLAALAEEAVSMGFRPLVYGNIKGFLNHDPSKEEMHHWARRNGISLSQVTSFTDGTKLQLEQTLVANGLGAGIAQRGLLGLRKEPLDIAGGALARKAKEMGTPLSDYVLNRDLPPGVFLVAEHPTERPEVLRYLKLGEGPYYTLLRPYHLCHLEMVRTIRRVMNGGGLLLNNSSTPTVTTVAVAKKDLGAGALIPQAIGGFCVRGEAVSFRDAPDAVPIGLLKGARVVRSIERGQTIEWDDVEIPESLALTAAFKIREQVLTGLNMLEVGELDLV